ncbi:hypothetical protein [Marinicrinis sediminis]|uniref:Uncharacterized protein n=1 Tax=Marinicrinis sediminis TaxID=1652465 RepID=A0ABW5RCA6_9BACL
MTDRHSGSDSEISIDDFRAQIKLALLDHPDLVFDEMIRIQILPPHIPDWLSFLKEWAGVLVTMEQHVTEAYQSKQLDEQAYEFSRRSYRLGMHTINQLFEDLQAFHQEQEQKGTAEAYLYRMNAADCYFIPAYLDDYSQQQKLVRPMAEAYIQAILTGFREEGDESAEKRLLHLQLLMQEYLTHLHVFAKPS